VRPTQAASFRHLEPCSMLAACRQAHNSPRTCARPATNGSHVAKLHTRVPRLPPPPAAAPGADHLPSDLSPQPAGSQAALTGANSQSRLDLTDSGSSAAAAEAARSAAPGVASPTGSRFSPAVDSPSAAPTVAAGDDTCISSSCAADSPSAPTTAEVPGNSPSAAPTEDQDDMDLQSILAALQGMGGGIFDAATVRTDTGWIAAGWAPLGYSSSSSLFRSTTPTPPPTHTHNLLPPQELEPPKEPLLLPFWSTATHAWC
jgi:hypothetical protein